jgi:hypothetical protein
MFFRVKKKLIFINFSSYFDVIEERGLRKSQGTREPGSQGGGRKAGRQGRGRKAGRQGGRRQGDRVH